jgi:hypothetical protein
LLTSNPTDALPSTTGHVPQPSHPVTRIRTAAALLPLLLLAGCFQLRALVRVAEDGSGTMEETVLFGAMVREMMAASGETPAIADLYHVDSLRAHAARLGTGVSLLRVDTLHVGEEFGYRAVYGFDDVTSLRFRFNPNPMTGSGTARSRANSGSMLAGTTPDLAVTFDREADGALVIRMPHRETAQDVAEPDRAAVAALTDSLRRQMEGGAAAASQILDGIRMMLEVRGPGPVASTDASFAADSAVVLFDYSMGAFVGLIRDKPELVARVQLQDRVGEPDTRPVVRAFAARPEVRYELAPAVTVRFGR